MTLKITLESKTISVNVAGLGSYSAKLTSGTILLFREGIFEPVTYTTGKKSSLTFIGSLASGGKRISGAVATSAHKSGVFSVTK